jgi:hypothetical protein
VFTAPADALPRTKRALRGRRLVVVDIENVVGGSVRTIQQAAAAHEAVRRTVALTGIEQVVIGSSPAGVLPSGLGWRGARLVARPGANGADLALLQILTDERIAERFDEVVLVSGDAIFTEAVADLGAAGVHVTVVSRHEACSKRLRLAAGQTVFLWDLAAELGDAA